MIYQNIDIKKLFQIRFRNLLDEEPSFKELLLNIFVYGTAYVVGGYFRDFFNNKESRDIDIIVDLDNVKLLDIICSIDCHYTTNRHGGIKLQLKKMDVDLWSLEKNWAFKNKLVKLNEKDKLNSIAKGCFFNYDSLVINLHNYTYNVRYYNDFLNAKTLDILQKSSCYKNLNPTVEANIIRAFYIKENMNVTFSENLTEYIVKKVESLSDRYTDGLKRIISVKTMYPKYKGFENSILIDSIIQTIEYQRKISDNLFLDF